MNISRKKAQSTLSCILFIALVGVFVYSFMVTDSFKTMDDKASIVNNELIKAKGNLDDLFKSSYFGKKAYWRPLVFLSYKAEYSLFGLNPYYYYLTNILIHLLSAVIIFFLLRLFYDENRLPFWGALLFVSHPIHWEAVSNIPGRAILLSALFYFLSFYLFCAYRQKKAKVVALVFSLIAFVLSLLSKESGMTLPILITAYLWFFERKPASRWAADFIVAVPYWAVLFAYLILRRVMGMVSLFYPRTVTESVLGFLTFLRSVLTHLRSFLFPYDLHFDRSREIFTSFGEPGLLLTAFVFLAAAAAFFHKKDVIPTRIKFFLCWFFIDLLPVSQLLVLIGTQPGRISTAEHFLYSASVGIFVVLVEAAAWIYRKNSVKNVIHEGVLKFVLLSVFVFWSLTTIRQNIIAGSELAMLKQSLRYNPDNVRIIESYGFALVSLNAFEEGEKYFRKVLEKNPRHIRARIALGKSLCDQGRCVEGMLEYEKIPDAGDLQEILEQNKKATYAVVIRKYEDRLKDEPDNARLHYSLGIVYVRLERYDDALAAFKEAIALAPDHKEAHFNLASLYDGLGRREEARRYYKKALTLKGGEPELDDYARKRLEELRS